MDLLTQLDEDIDLLLKIMSSSIAYISRKAAHTPLPSSTIPLTVLGRTEAVSAEELDASIAELVSDLVGKAESIRAIIQHLPTEASLGGDRELELDLERMRREMAEVNDEYRRVSGEVETLRREVGDLVTRVGEMQVEGRGWLVRELEGGDGAARAEAGVGIGPRGV